MKNNIFLTASCCCIDTVEQYTALESQNAVSANFTSKQILPFGFVRYYSCRYIYTNIDHCWSSWPELSHGRHESFSANKTFVYHLYNVGPTSSTLVQHCTSVIQSVGPAFSQCSLVTQCKSKIPRRGGTLEPWRLCCLNHVVMQSQKAVTAYLSSKQLLPSGFAMQHVTALKNIHLPQWVTYR